MCFHYSTQLKTIKDVFVFGMFLLLEKWSLYVYLYNVNKYCYMINWCKYLLTLIFKIIYEAKW